MDTDKPDFISTDATALENGKSSARVVQWAVWKKPHSDCVSKDYQMAVKLSATRRWLRLSQS